MSSVWLLPTKLSAVQAHEIHRVPNNLIALTPPPGTRREIALGLMQYNLNNDKSGNGLEPSGSKPSFPVPILTQIYVAIWRH